MENAAFFVNDSLKKKKKQTHVRRMSEKQVVMAETRREFDGGSDSMLKNQQTSGEVRRHLKQIKHSVAVAENLRTYSIIVRSQKMKITF